ncbi:MAG TPA: hypothetical protein VJS92_08700 [Candidatus Polarisedimenticolaceae bacterium]|nr:hypothetical protein [Candidatus Polarisedimenticolaceae bacterium]
MTRRTATWLVSGSLIVSALAFVSAVIVPAQAGPRNCRFVSCPPPACEAGEHMAVPPGQCCPVCVPD